MTINANSPSGAEEVQTNRHSRGSDSATGVTPIQAIAIILAHGVIRLHQRQKKLDNHTEQTLQNVADRPMFLLDGMKSKAVRGEPYVLNT
jgi:hypothetical protein